MAFETQKVHYILFCLLDLSKLWWKISDVFLLDFSNVNWIKFILISKSFKILLFISSKFSFQCLYFALNMFLNTWLFFPFFFLLVSNLSLLQCCLSWGTSEGICNHSFTVPSSFIPLLDPSSGKPASFWPFLTVPEHKIWRVKASVTWCVSGATVWLRSSRRVKQQTPPASSASIHQLLPFLHRDTREKEIFPSCKKYILVFSWKVY